MPRKPADPFAAAFPLVDGDLAAFRAALDAAAVAALPTDPRLLFEAMRHARADVVALLLSLGADPNAEQDGVPAFLYNPGFEVVKALLAAGADVARFGEAALHAVVNDVPALRLLLDAGVPLTTLTEQDWGFAYENRALMQLLAEAGVDLGPALVLAVINAPTPVVRFLLKLRGKRRWTDATAPHHAVQREKRDTLKALLAAGFSPHARDEQGQTPLHGVFMNEKPQMARLLLAAGAKVDAVDPARQTPLMVLAQWGFPRLHVASALLAAGASVSRKGADGRTALTLARLQGNAPLVELLRAHGARDQPDFAAEVEAREAELAEKARVSAANHARALAFFERRNGKSGRGRSTGGRGGAYPGHAVRLSGKRVAIWFPQHYPPSEVVIEPASNWIFDRGQDPGPLRRAKKRAAPVPTGAALQARLDAVDAAVAAGGVTLKPGASDKAIAAAEKKLGVAFSEPLRAWLRRHEGGPISLADELLTLGQIVEASREQNQMAPEVEELGWSWGPGLIPITHNGGGDHAALDLRPGSKAPGQVLMVWHDSEPRVEAETFLDWLDGQFWGDWQ